MPFHLNNVDLAVNANSLYGLNSLLTTLPIKEAEDLFLLDGDLRGIHRNVTNLLAHGIKSGIAFDRPELSLTYYPSEFDFYWFVARIVHQLRSNKHAKGILLFPELEYCLKTLEDVLINVGTSQLLGLAHNTTLHVYWEGFLGNYANKTRHEDRLFSTSVTVNTLLDIYTITEPDRKSRSWIPHTPLKIKETIMKAIDFIIFASNEKSTSYMNCFFSGSAKGFESLPFLYPANNAVYRNNGTHIDPRTSGMEVITDDLIDSWKATVSSEEYKKLLNDTWFQIPTPTTFSGFNQLNQGFPFWSSNSITQVFIIQALSKFISTNPV